MPVTGTRTVYLQTFGCQMNELDSELVRGQLAALGYSFTPDADAADVVLYNTCSVREQAENKVLSRVGKIGIRKREGARVVLGLIGCLAEREGMPLLSRFPQIDLLCGPGELDRLPMLIDNALKTETVEAADRVALAGNRSRRTATLAAAADNLELLDLSRAFDPDGGGSGGSGGSGGPRRSAYVRITRGCNKFCTYCVVPFTRGAEVHRPPDAIVLECRRLADGGVVEITLLGQTVNRYLYTHGVAMGVNGQEVPQVGPGGSAFTRSGPRGANGRRVTTFADLLGRIHEEVPSLRRLRFVTCYPRDFGDDILRVMRDCPRICRYLHVPAQSGSDRILRLMNRGYTSGEYLEFIDRARDLLPDVSIAGDVIVGFPTETEHDFGQTADLLGRVRFKNNFIFKYSPRPGTTAWDRLPDDVPTDVKRRRNNDLLALQAGISAAVHAEQVGRTVEVFVEGVSRKGASRAAGRVELGWERPRGRIQMSGRTAGDLITVFDLPQDGKPERLQGRIVPVRVLRAAALVLFGRLEAATLPPAKQPAAVHRARPSSGITQLEIS